MYRIEYEADCATLFALQKRYGSHKEPPPGLVEVAEQDAMTTLFDRHMPRHIERRGFEWEGQRRMFLLLCYDASGVAVTYGEKGLRYFRFESKGLG